MHRQSFIVAYRILLSGLLMLTAYVHAADHRHDEAHETRHQAGSTCPGFVLLPNGYAVLSQMPAAPEHGGAPTHQMGAHMEAAMVQTDHDQASHQGHSSDEQASHESGGPQHLMGYRHGQPIMLQKERLCVPIGSKDDTAWTAVSSELSLFVMVESLKGPLSHNSRTSEALAFTIVQRGENTPVDQARVRLLVRMPHHDRHMPGGHSIANDPDGQGLETHLDEKGRYIVPTVDFSMAGPWLFEVQVQLSADTLTAYFAADVDED